MGGLFSKTAEMQQSPEELKRIQELKRMLIDNQNAIASAEEEAKRILEAQFERQKKIAKQRIYELKEMLRRAKEIRDARKALNIRSAVLLCALFHNYPFGKLDADSSDVPKGTKTDGSWTDNASTIVTMALTKEVFWVMVRIPELCPLFWPTGSSDIEAKFHEYTKRDEKDVPVPGKYIVDINTHIDAYIKDVLPQYITSVFQSNCSRNPVTDTDYNDAIYSACAKFIETVEMVQNDDDLVYRLSQFIKNDEYMNWKCLTARADKGVTKARIRLLPANYPKRCPRYELYEGLLMVTNTILNRYGECQNIDDGGPAPAVGKVSGQKKVNIPYNQCTQEQKDTLDKTIEYRDTDIVTVMQPVYEIDLTATNTVTEGGKCFALNPDWVKNTYMKAIGNYSDERKFWDGITYIPAEDVILKDADITGIADYKDWMTKTIVHNQAEAFYKNLDDKANMKGWLRWENPTRKWTYEFLNDADDVKLPFKMPLLGANIDNKFRWQFLLNAYTILTTAGEDDPVYQWNPYRIANKMVMTSLDFATITPKELESEILDKTMSPLAAFLFAVMIEYSCKWSLTFPINNSMSMGMINNAIMNDPSNKRGVNALPQNIWTRTKNFVMNPTPTEILDPLPEHMPIRTSETFNTNNIKDITALSNAIQETENRVTGKIYKKQALDPVADVNIYSPPKEGYIPGLSAGLGGIPSGYIAGLPNGFVTLPHDKEPLKMFTSKVPAFLRGVVPTDNK